MRELEIHQIDERNETVAVEVHSPHRYRVCRVDGASRVGVCTIPFHHGEGDLNGVTDRALLAILLDRAGDAPHAHHLRLALGDWR